MVVMLVFLKALAPFLLSYFTMTLNFCAQGSPCHAKGTWRTNRFAPLLGETWLSRPGLPLQGVLVTVGVSEGKPVLVGVGDGVNDAVTVGVAVCVACVVAVGVQVGVGVLVGPVVGVLVGVGVGVGSCSKTNSTAFRRGDLLM